MIKRVVFGALAGLAFFPTITGVIILVVRGGYLAASAFGPVDRPEGLNSPAAVMQLLAVTGYVGMYVGALLGAVWAGR